MKEAQCLSANISNPDESGLSIMAKRSSTKSLHGALVCVP